MSQIAQPSNPALASNGRLKDAVYDFTSMYALPSVDPDNIFWANQNRAALPAGIEDFISLYLVSQVRHGTPVEILIPGEDITPDKLGISSLYEYLIQIDFYSNSLNYARDRAMTIANIGRSSIGPQFFNQPQYGGVSLLYVDDPRDMTVVMDSQQFVQRYMVQLRCTQPEITTVEFQAFDVVELNRVENVDVHHPAFI